jgi:hypothetical protein
VADSAEKIVRKSVFASMCGVTPARVSQWLSEGKLTGEALVGEGRTAKINVAVAIEQLKARLDASQRFGLNGLATRLTAASAPPPLEELPFETSPEGVPPPPFDMDDSVVKRIQAEKLRQAELLTMKMEAEERRGRGVYVLAVDVERDFRKLATELLASWEGHLPDIAAAVAGQFGIPTRDALAMLKKNFNAFRARISKNYADLAASKPEFIEDHETYH